MEDKQLFNVEKRGTKTPVYTTAGLKYRSDVLTKLNTAAMTRETPTMYFDDRTYTDRHLRNTQLDVAYNPPKTSPADVRYTSGSVHEKDNTAQAAIVEMNLQPRVRVFDKDDKELVDESMVLTAKLKKSLIKENFKGKEYDIIRTFVAQGNVFLNEHKNNKYVANKIKIGTGEGANSKWKTIIELEDSYCDSTLIPNTGVFLGDITQTDIKKQPYIFTVMHVPTVEVAQVFNKFSKWDEVPKSMTNLVKTTVDDIIGEYFYIKPAEGFTEVIVYQNKPLNEYNVFLNGTMMYPVQEEDGVITGYPLTNESLSGEYTVIKGDNESIPHFAYAKGYPEKNEVKQEIKDGLTRTMVYKMRQSAKPPIGNNSDRLLPLNIFDPGVVTPGVRAEEIQSLISNPGITNGDTTLYSIIDQSMDETSLSKSMEGVNTQKSTATQYVDQLKQQAKKFGLTVAKYMEFLQSFYWQRLYNEIMDLDKKKKMYSHEDDSFVEAYQSFVLEDNIDGAKGNIKVNLVDKIPDVSSLDILKEEEEMLLPTKIIYTNPKYIKSLVKNMPNRIYIEVIAEPEGEEGAKLAGLFNLLTQFANLRGGDTSTINFGTIEKLIEQNSPYEAEELFTKPEAQTQDMMSAEQQIPGMTNQPKPPQNAILANQM